MRRLISLILKIDRPVSSSILRSLSVERTSSSRISASLAEYGLLRGDFWRQSRQLLFSLPVKDFTKFFFGILAYSTQCFMTIRSCTRTRSIISRMFLTRRSNCFGTKRKQRNTSRQFVDFVLWCWRAHGHFRRSTGELTSYWVRSSPNFSRAISGSGPVSPSSDRRLRFLRRHLNIGVFIGQLIFWRHQSRYEWRLVPSHPLRLDRQRR